MTTDVSVVIPFLNEEASLAELMASMDAFAMLVPYSIEVIMVDDGSTDASCALLRGIKPKSFTAKLVRLSRNFGSHAAIRAGLSQACGRYATFIGADLQEPLPMITDMYEKAESGYDVVCVEKRATQVGRAESLLSRTYSKMIRKFAVPNMPLGGCNNIMMSRRVLAQFNARIESNSAIVLQVLHMGYPTAVIQSDMLARAHGESKWTMSKKVKMFIDAFVAFSFAPIRLISIVGIISAMLGFLVALFTILNRVFGWIAMVSGWATLTSLLLLGFGFTNISLGIIAEYLWRTLDVARNRPVYIVDSTEELSSQVQEG